MNPANPFRRVWSHITRLILLSVGLGSSAAFAQPSHVHLPATAKGAGAISALGAHLPEVAKAYGLNSQQLITFFQTQDDLAVDREGALLFLCEGLAVAPGTVSPVKSSGTPMVGDAMTPNSSVTIIANGGTVDAFKLHSLPGCPRVIYLDFTGHTTSGTSWNSSYASGADIVSAAFSLDGDATTFNATELAMIQKIWQRVAEDYAPFTVDVTTEDPGIDGLRRNGSTDTAYGIRVVISPTNWYNTNAGGVAYIGSFNASTDTPCFAFTQQLANGEKYIAEAAAHEVGHTLGLYHDGLGGTTPTQYYQGQGNWAPIMGVGYYKPLVQFSKGEYADANNTQDDLAVITSYVPLAPDDHGNTLATASVLAGPSVADGGTIESRTDVDVFRFDTGAGAISLTIKGPGPDTNVDLRAELLDAAGQVLQTSDSSSTLSAAISASVGAGTYYLRISSVGLGDPLTTGYSSYGSIGNYVITGTLVPTGTKQAPVAAISATTTSGIAPLTVSFSGIGSTDADGTIVSYSWDLGNGTSATGLTASATYATAGTYTATLTVVDSDGLADTAVVSVTVNSPPNVPPVAMASANVTSGLAPLTVTFSSTGSYDPDGSLASYKWDFGDGTSSTAVSPTKTYTVPGNYTAKLTVTDLAGATNSATVAITVQRNPASDVDVSGFVLSKNSSKSGATVVAAITVLDRMGQAVSGATIVLQWSGVVAGTATAQTNAFGQVTFTSQRTKKSGLETAKITRLTPPTGNAFDDTLYSAPLSQSIAVP